MSKIKEYSINGALILGVDAGYGNYKTAHCTFPTSIKEGAPIIGNNCLEYGGKLYTLGEERKDFVANKVTDEDNYLLTLAAIAKELHARGTSEARIHLAVGLPLKWMQSQKDEFRAYMLQNPHVDLRYYGQNYSIDFVDCTVMPQCYAAVAEDLHDFVGMNMLADIGNGTMNILVLNNGKALESRAWTVKLGVHQCFKQIRNYIMDQTGERLPDEVIENYLKSGKADVAECYAQSMQAAAAEYVRKIFAELRDHDYNPDLMKLYVMGGGARIVEAVGEYDPERVTFNHDLRANAKGYEYFCYMKLRKDQGHRN